MRVRKKKWAQAAIDNTEQCLEMNEACLNKNKWREFVAKQTQQPQLQQAPLYLEIGCGKGKFLVEQSELNKQAIFLGIDLEINALCFAAKKIAEKNLPVALIYGTAERLSDCFGKEEIERIYLNFSTPWPKTKHHKRRLTYPTFLEQYLTILKEGGEIYLKTDNPDFYAASLAYLQYMGFKIVENTADLDHANDPTGVMTEYETKWRQQNLPIHLIVAVKPQVSELQKLQAEWQAPTSRVWQDPSLAYDFNFYKKLLKAKALKAANTTSDTEAD